ncbi:SDR family oxidoreductase [Deinococcus cellulosilyticus]|uniref:Short-chain dehydrogenase n=1 Tax=Deinococcus cellulosilyticus (strain DSM 18568 / NBRC 106333 / KACC 11606 / 5516J-15) TaxID=1223518 RepID=A0A511N116_DEIC1|nr:SDR family oxidoreductase [Deinococcus cellulosilyticus]GEM46161.1 short-chain dehydrogenase [Deinococcus cellulosilyticus NBRC 106333 = KACC 11606]
MKYQNALITGGSKGIGYSIAKTLLEAGLNVTITARKQEELDAAAQSLGQPEKVLAVKADAREYSQLEAAVQAHLEKFGALDVVVANAGVGVFKPVQDLSIEDWHAVIDTNLTGVFYTLKASVDALSKTKGYLITISSLAGKNPFAGGAAYNASKFGLNGFTEAAMLDLRALGIKATQIMPGSVATHFNNHTPNEQDAWKIQPEDIAQIVQDLLEMNERTLPSRVEVRPSQPKKG